MKNVFFFFLIASFPSCSSIVEWDAHGTIQAEIPIEQEASNEKPYLPTIRCTQVYNLQF